MYNDSRYSGTDTNILTIQHVKKSEEGLYRCTVRNQMDKKISEEAQLTVRKESFIKFELIGASLSGLASFPGPAHSSLAVQNLCRISYCKG